VTGCPRLIEKRIYRGRGLTKVENHYCKEFECNIMYDLYQADMDQEWNSINNL
jgi:hypothetical protein